MAKKNVKGAKGPTPHLRSRTTRSSRGRLVTSSDSNPNEQLSTQLSLLGLYAAPTIGDGNCLFRALADQVHGSAVMHGEVRKQVCDWIEAHGERYEGFVEDEGEESDGRGKRRGKAGKTKDPPGKDAGTAGPSKRLQAYLRGMRENATYGGHMELSAFAHMTRRNIKVVQPGLVYVIEWRAGGGSAAAEASSSSAPPSQSDSQTAHPTNSPPATPERRRSTRTPSISSPRKGVRGEEDPSVQKIRTGHGYYVYEEVTSDEEDAADGDGNAPDSAVKEEEREEKEVAEIVGADAEEDAGPTIYVAYHDWEHFSSIRNLRGPHTGLPNIHETPAQTEAPPPPEERAKEALKEREREKKRERERKATDKKARDALKVKLKVPPNTVAASDVPPAAVHDPLLIPLPTSRTVSPFPHVSPTPDAVGTPQRHPMSAPSSSASSGELRVHARQPHLQAGTPGARAQYRSPKRTFDESSASGGEDADGREGREKRSRTRAGSVTATAAGAHDMDVDVDGEAASPDTPGLSAPGTSSSSETSSEASEGSPSTSPSPAPEVPGPPVSAPSPKALTRRQRKALGLPKPRSALGPAGASAGKIVIPGGRWTGRPLPPAATADAEADEEWRRNGTGRLDVRGFRELKI